MNAAGPALIGRANWDESVFRLSLDDVGSRGVVGSSWVFPQFV
jgi:hypothetical protein